VRCTSLKPLTPVQHPLVIARIDVTLCLCIIDNLYLHPRASLHPPRFIWNPKGLVPLCIPSVFLKPFLRAHGLVLNRCPYPYSFSPLASPRSRSHQPVQVLWTGAQRDLENLNNAVRTIVHEKDNRTGAFSIINSKQVVSSGAGPAG
jgi:hypothetical protein